MAAGHDSPGQAPTPDEIRAEVERIIASEVLSRSPQLGAFLRFVVEATLAGKADRIKAYTIGVEVLRRDTKFDPQADPIVRVEATRLRRALERYYAGPGIGDATVVDLPRGSYVPAFGRRQAPLSRSALTLAVAARTWGRLRASPTLARWAVVALVAVVVVEGALLYSRSTATPPAGVASMKLQSGRPAVPLPAGNGMPTIHIEPLRVVGAAVPRNLAPDILFEKINDAFARFDTINVVLEPQKVAAAGTAPAGLKPDYRLSGGVEFGDQAAHAWFKLIDVAEGSVVWSRIFERIKRSGEPGAGEQAIVVALTNSLLQSYGVIRARDRARHLATSAGDPRYRCVLEAADAIRTADRATHDRARECLERLAALDPGFAVGLTFLSLIYSREFQLGYELRPGDMPPLERALRTVRQAIALWPESSRGWLALMVIQFNRRDIAAALAAGDKCLALNRYDMLAVGEYGGRLILSGDVERGMQMLHEAGAEGANRPAWHHIYLFLGSYIAGDIKSAVHHAGQIPNDNVALGQVAQVLAAKASGDAAAIRKAVARLIDLQPNWRNDARGELARLIADPAIVDRLARDLAAAMAGGA